MTQSDYVNRFTQVAQYMVGLTQRKNADYAGSEDAFKNFELIEVLTSGRISTAAGILVRLTDKLQRMANLLARPPQVVEESLEDTCLDNAVYSMIMYLWATRHKKELTFPGQVPAEPPPPVVEPAPEGASPNTGDDAYHALVARVEKDGAAALSPTERMYLEMVIRMKMGEGTVAA